MTRHPKARTRARLLRSLYIWHRYLGLTAALFVVLLCITGLALNHTEALRLDARHVQSDALLDWYGIQPPGTLISYRAGTATLTQLGEQIYWNRRRIPEAAAPLSGAVSYAGLVVAAAADSLLLFTSAGELIERLGPATGLPVPVTAIGTDAAGGLVVAAAGGRYRSDENFLEWKPATQRAVTWAEPARPDQELERALRTAWRGTGLPLERVLLDLHSGRILGSWGVWLVDAAALLFLVLAGSGIWLWGRRRASAREHRRNIRTRHEEPSHAAPADGQRRR